MQLAIKIYACTPIAIFQMEKEANWSGVIEVVCNTQLSFVDLFCVSHTQTHSYTQKKIKLPPPKCDTIQYTHLDTLHDNATTIVRHRRGSTVCTISYIQLEIKTNERQLEFGFSANVNERDWFGKRERERPSGRDRKKEYNKSHELEMEWRKKNYFHPNLTLWRELEKQ